MSIGLCQLVNKFLCCIKDLITEQVYSLWNFGCIWAVLKTWYNMYYFKLTSKSRLTRFYITILLWYTQLFLYSISSVFPHFLISSSTIIHYLLYNEQSLNVYWSTSTIVNFYMLYLDSFKNLVQYVLF